MAGSQIIGYLQLEAENVNLYAGQELSGVIHLKLDQGLQAGFLYLKFKGKETTQWLETRHEAPGKVKINYNKTHRGHVQIVRQKFPVFTFAEGFVDSGHFSFPFRFILPNDIPSTFHYDHRSTHANINYELTALIDDPHKQVKKSKAKILVSGLHTAPIYPVSDSLNARISTCCWSQGTLQMKADYNKNAFSPGETAELAVEINNTSRLDVQRLRARFFRYLRLRSDSGNWTIFRKDLNIQEEERRIAAGASAKGEERVRILIPIQDSKGDLQQCSSVNGTRIECMYMITVHAYMNGNCMCCGDRRDTLRVVPIYPHQLPSPEIPEISPDWNPQIMPVTLFRNSQDADYKSTALVIVEGKQNTK